MSDSTQKPRCNQTTDKDIVILVLNGKTQKPCSRDEALTTVANLDDQTTTWSIIS